MAHFEEHPSFILFAEAKDDSTVASLSVEALWQHCSIGMDSILVLLKLCDLGSCFDGHRVLGRPKIRLGIPLYQVRHLSQFRIGMSKAAKTAQLSHICRHQHFAL